VTGLREVTIIGGGLAGLSAALYLGQSRRDTLLIHSGRSMAKWEADVQNYLGFPDGIDGTGLSQPEAIRDLAPDMRTNVAEVLDQ